MYGFLRKNNKKLMAIFAAFLMVAFIADIGMRKGGGGRGAGDHVLGHLSDGEKLLASDFQESEAEWRLLTQLQMTPPHCHCLCSRLRSSSA